jgi:hypothetical protein
MAREERMMWLGEMETETPGPEEEYSMKWMREVEETGSEEDRGGGVREERRDRQTLHNEALDLFTQETHEPGHQHTSASRSHGDRVVAAAVVPRSDPCCYRCCCCHGTPLDENGIR